PALSTRSLRAALPIFAGAISSAGLACPVLLGDNIDAVPGSVAMSQVADTRETEAVAAAFAAITSETAAKHLLTSGSTGLPKIVINRKSTRLNSSHVNS